MQAFLALEDGRVFPGKSHGATGECCGEVVFNTAITGYQEIFTDPSYVGQIVILTHPHIGNYGTNPEDSESARPYIEGLVVREFSAVASNWRSQQEAEQFLKQHRIPGDRRAGHADVGASPAQSWGDARGDLHAGVGPAEAPHHGSLDSSHGGPGPSDSRLHPAKLPVDRAGRHIERGGRGPAGALPRGGL